MEKSIPVTDEYCSQIGTATIETESQYFFDTVVAVQLTPPTYGGKSKYVDSTGLEVHRPAVPMDCGITLD